MYQISQYIQDSSVEIFLKITVRDENNSIFNEIIRRLKEIVDIDILDVSHMSRKIIRDGSKDLPIEYYYIEITNKNVNEWNAIEFLIEQLNIKPEEVNEIDDNVNDKETIINSGLGVAMGNISPAFREIADITVSDNNSDGVAEVIEKYVLN